MQTKNSFKNELKNKQKSFLLIGMFVALGMSLMAFEWASFELEHIHVDELVVENIDAEPAVEMIQIEKPKPRVTQKVKEREFDPNKDIEFKKVDKIDSTVVLNPDLPVDTTLGDNDIKIVDLGGDGPVEIEEPFIIVEKMPEFPGGQQKLYEYLGKTIKYPEIDKQIGTQGKVFLTFVIEKDGSITDIQVIRSLSEGCDKEATKAVKNMPNWSPGEQRGQKVRVKYTLPVHFKLK